MKQCADEVAGLLLLCMLKQNAINQIAVVGGGVWLDRVKREIVNNYIIHLDRDIYSINLSRV